MLAAWEPQAKRLVAFERRMAELFNAGKIRAPIHLDGGNERPLIEVFKDVRPGDWVCGSWRMHYKCLLKGVPEQELEESILAGRSIALCFPKYRIVSSAIVAGVVPVAVGLALAIARRGGDERVWCFVGDMTATTGVYHECVQFAAGHALPIRFVVEDNGVSVCTGTYETWGGRRKPRDMETRFTYHLPWPHSGAGQRVQF